MKKEDCNCDCCNNKIIVKSNNHGGGDSGMIYFLGVVGALFYFLKGVTEFSAILLGIGKAIVWPALLMFELLSYLKI